MEPGDDGALLDAMERALALGDHGNARRCARDLLARSEGEARARIDRVLRATEPDRFIELVVVVGLGLVAWLVHTYGG